MTFHPLNDVFVLPVVRSERQNMIFHEENKKTYNEKYDSHFPEGIWLNLVIVIVFLRYKYFLWFFNVWKFLTVPP